MYWSEDKTFHSDRSNFEIDLIHSLACYFIYDAGTHHLNASDPYAQWIFPNMNGLKNGCSTKTTNYIRELVPPDDIITSKRYNLRTLLIIIIKTQRRSGHVVEGNQNLRRLPYCLTNCF